MKVISLITQKGGAGKSTLAISCAVESFLKGKKVFLFDTDPQGSAINDWYADRPEELEQPFVAEISTNELPKAIQSAQKKGFDFVFVDTAGRDSLGIQNIIKLSDFCLVPCRPTKKDLRATIPSIQAIQEAKKPFAFVINQANQQHKRSSQATELLKNIGTVCPHFISSLVAFQDADMQGLGVTEYEPNGKAHQEIQSLWKWLDNQLNKI